MSEHEAKGARCWTTGGFCTESCRAWSSKNQQCRLLEAIVAIPAALREQASVGERQARLNPQRGF